MFTTRYGLDIYFRFTLLSKFARKTDGRSLGIPVVNLEAQDGEVLSIVFERVGIDIKGMYQAGYVNEGCLGEGK